MIITLMEVSKGNYESGVFFVHSQESRIDSFKIEGNIYDNK